MPRSTTPSKLRKTVLALASICIGLALGLLLVEGILRLLPVNEPLSSNTPVTAKTPILHLKKNSTLTFSKGFDFNIVNTVHTNNYGFVHDSDYEKNGKSPLLAIIGDSYVEAAMVPFSETITGRLEKAATTDRRVYSFATSGSPLSQYLVYARYAKDNFSPDAMVFVIVGNDFDESLGTYKQQPGYHYFFPSNDGEFELRLVEWRASHPTWLHSIASAMGLGKTALARYIRPNLPSLLQQVKSALSSTDEKQAYVGQTRAKADPRRLALSKRAVIEFLSRLPEATGLPRQDVAMVVDGMRPHLYDEHGLEAAKGSYFDQMRQFFIHEARKLGYEVVDMEDIFRKHYAINRQRFEFPTDGHWNSLGHELAAQAVNATSTFKEFKQLPAQR